MPVVLLFIIFVVLLMIAIPVSITLGITAVLPSIFDPSFTVGAKYLIRAMFGGLDSFPLLAVPMFVYITQRSKHTSPYMIAKVDRHGISDLLVSVRKTPLELPAVGKSLDASILPHIKRPRLRRMATFGLLLSRCACERQARLIPRETPCHSRFAAAKVITTSHVFLRHSLR